MGIANSAAGASNKALSALLGVQSISLEYEKSRDREGTVCVVFECEGKVLDYAEPSDVDASDGPGLFEIAWQSHGPAVLITPIATMEIKSPCFRLLSVLATSRCQMFPDDLASQFETRWGWQIVVSASGSVEIPLTDGMQKRVPVRLYLLYRAAPGGRSQRIEQSERLLDQLKKETSEYKDAIDRLLGAEKSK